MTSAFAQAAADLRDAVKAQVKTLFEGEDVVVASTTMALDYADDLVIIGAVRTTQEHATSNRGREVTLELEVQFHSFRLGDDEADDAAFARVVEMASRLSEYLRDATALGNTGLGGAVRDCFEVEWDADSGDLQTDAGTGRLWVGIAVYQAHARLRG